MVILVPPDSGPVEGWTRVKYGDCEEKVVSGRLREKEEPEGNDLESC